MAKPKPEKNLKKLQVEIDEAVLERLRTHCVLKGVLMRQYVETALDEALRRDEDQ